jgi:hypothetical protein
VNSIRRCLGKGWESGKLSLIEWRGTSLELVQPHLHRAELNVSDVLGSLRVPQVTTVKRISQLSHAIVYSITLIVQLVTYALVMALLCRGTPRELFHHANHTTNQTHWGRLDPWSEYVPE